MINITSSAAKQIMQSVKQSNSEGMALRVAATRNDDNSIHYGMGFDDVKDNDVTVESDGIKIIVSPLSAELLKDTTLDFVELEPGKHQFIFMNPNDPDYTPPSEN